MLKKLRSWLLGLFVFSSMLVGFWVYTENPQELQLMLFGFSMGVRSLGFWIILAFISGIALGLFCNVILTSWMGFQIRKLKKQLQSGK